MDLIRDILLALEDSPDLNGSGSYDRASGTFDIERLSMDGHDFLDSVRDQEVWKKTKNGAEAAGGFTLDLLKDLAKGFIKKQIEELTDVKL